MRILDVKNYKKVTLDRDEWAKLLKKDRAHQGLSSQCWWWDASRWYFCKKKNVLLEVHKLFPFIPSGKTLVCCYYLCVMDWSCTQYLWKSRRNSLNSLTRKLKSQRQELFASWQEGVREPIVTTCNPFVISTSELILSMSEVIIVTPCSCLMIST
jgi:hypothetical protein